MALDHFVSQVHLKNFYSDQLDRRQMFAYRKSKLDSFRCSSADVCRIPDGSTNEFLEEPRAIEEYLKLIEPHYNRACDNLATDKFDHGDIIVLSGFCAFVMSCSPTAMRLGAHFFSVFAALELELLDGIGEIPPPPVETGARSATELLQSGMLRVDVDAKYPQAVSISQISDLARNFASSRWEILLNAHSSSTPFVTSDYPVSLERVQGRAMRVVAFRPDLAVRIWPNADIRDREPTIEDFRHRYLAPSKAEVRGVVRTIVRSAEDFIFSPQSSEGLKRLVSKHANFRVENIARRIPVNGGTKLHNSQHVVERTSG